MDKPPDAGRHTRKNDMSDGLLLIVGDRIDGHLLEALQGAGYAAVFMKSMEDALSHVRDGRFVAVVVDCRPMCEDVLEFALNVRDFRSTIPLVVIGAHGENKSGLLMGGQPYTKLLGARVTPSEFVAAMNSLLSPHATRPPGEGALEQRLGGNQDEPIQLFARRACPEQGK